MPLNQDNGDSQFLQWQKMSPSIQLLYPHLWPAVAKQQLLFVFFNLNLIQSAIKLTFRWTECQRNSVEKLSNKSEVDFNRIKSYWTCTQIFFNAWKRKVFLFFLNSNCPFLNLKQQCLLPAYSMDICFQSTHALLIIPVRSKTTNPCNHILITIFSL